MFRKLRFLLPLLAILALQGPAIAQTKAGAPQASDACVVPDFSVTTYVGVVDTKNLGLDCKARIYALAYFGKVAKTMESDAREAGSGEWTKDGGKMAREMADLAAKSSEIKAFVDMAASGVKAYAKYLDNKGTKAVISASLDFTSKAVTFANTRWCANGVCKPKNEEIIALAAETFKLMGKSVACAENKKDKCAEAIYGLLKETDSVYKFFTDKKIVNEKLKQWVDFSVDAIGVLVGVRDALASGNNGAFLSSVGVFVEVGLKTTAGTYWRDAAQLPNGWQNTLEILGNATSTWMSCAGASVSLKSPGKPWDIAATTAACVANVTSYLNSRIAETMSYSVALYKASQEQYKSKVIQGALVTLAERFKYNDQNSAFNANGLATGGGSIFSPTKEMNSSAFVYKVCAPEKYNVDYTGLAAWHASTYDGFSGDVLRMITPYLAAINAEFKAIETKQQPVTSYSGIKFYKNANATLIAPSKLIWDHKFDEYGFFMKAETIGAVDQVALQAVSASGDVLVSTPMEMKRFDDKTGITSWEVNLTKLKSWLALVDGSYNLRVGLLEADSRKPAFSNIVQIQIKSIATNPLPANPSATEIHLLSPDLTLRPGGMLTVRAEVVKSNGAAPILYVIDKAGNGVIGAAFNLKVSSANGVEQWQYQKADTTLVPGTYTLIAKATGQGNKSVESGSIRLVVEASAPVQTPSVPAPIPVSQQVALTLNMLDFLPRELTVGQLVKFVVQTNIRAKGASLIFDQLQGGHKVGMTNPSGNGIDWVYEQKVTFAGQAANNFQRPVWAMATTMDDKETPPMGPRPLVVKAAAQQAPVAQPAQPAALSLNMLDFLPRELTAGQLVKFVVQTNTRAKSASLLFDQLQGGTKVDMSNPTGNGIDWVYEQVVNVAGQPANNFQRPVWAVATGMDGKATSPMGPRPLVVKAAAQQAPVALPAQPAALSLNMLDFLPRELTAGQLVKFVVQTNTRAKSASLLFDQLQGGTKVDMSNPTGNGIDWVYEQVVNVAGQPANNFQRPVWAVATGVDGKATAPMGPRPLVVKAAAQQAPVTQPVQPAALSLNMLDFLPRELTAGQLVKFVVQTNTRAKSASLLFDQLQGGTKVDMSNPTGNGIDWVYEQVVNVAGQPANNFQRPVWAVATGMDGKATSPMGPRPLVVKAAAQQAPVAQPAQPAALSLNMLDFLPRELTAGQLVKFVVQTNTRAKSASLQFDQLQGGTKVDMSNPTGNGIDWVYEQVVNVAGQPANNFQRPVWAVATGVDGKATAPMGPRPLVVKAAAQQAPVTQPVQPANSPISSVSPLAGQLGQRVRFTVKGVGLAPTIKLLLSGEQCSASLRGDASQREFECTVNSPATPKQLLVTSLQGAQLAQFAFQVQVTGNAPITAPVAIAPPVEPLVPKLAKADSIASGTLWPVQLVTNVPVVSADIVFRTGRRVPFIGGPNNWRSDDRNGPFVEAGRFDYELQIKRQANAPIETFLGGALTVTPSTVPRIAPTVVSAPTVEQGKGYVLTVKTSAPADRVSVKWPDMPAEQGLRALDPQRTQWEFGSRLFTQAQPINFAVNVYKDGISQAVGQMSGTLNVTQPAAAIRLLDVSRNIVQGETPSFTVATSLSVSRVTVQLGNLPAVTLNGNGGSGAEQTFKGLVPASVAGASVPYSIVGFNAQGQPVTRLDGTVPVTAGGDSLRVPNPVPVAGIAQGDYVNWQFLTNKAPAEMWMEFDAPIGRLPLNGSYLTRVFNEPPGAYKYRLMRKDHLGNVYPIQGANGELSIKPRVVQGITKAAINGAMISPNAVLSTSLNAPLNLQAVAAGAKGIVMRVNIPKLGSPVYFQYVSGDGVNWSGRPLPTPTLGGYFQGQVPPGDYPARIYLGTGGTNTDANLGGTVDFVLRITP